MRFIHLAVVVTWVVAAIIGTILAANIFKLGIQEGFEIYGEVFTFISALGLLPLLLGVGSLFDRAQRMSREARKWPLP